MISVLYVVNTIGSTSIPIEIGNAVTKHTESNVTVGALMESSDTDIDPDVLSMDVPIVFFGGSGNFDVAAYRRLWDHLKETDYDIIHTHHNFSGSVSRFIGRLAGLKIINTEHNDHRHFSLLQRSANTSTYLLSDANVYNSKSTRSSLDPIAQALSRRDEVIYNGIDIERIEKGKEYTLPVDLPDGTLVTNVGVMTEQKNQEGIIEAAELVKEKFPMNDVYFVIGGSGPLKKELEAKASQKEVDDIVYFTGYLPQREHVYKLLHESDVFVNPSVYEGFCVAAVEAMACRLPIIASDIAVFNEVIGKDGIFIDHSDPHALADEITKTVKRLDNPTIEQRREKLRQRASKKYPIERTAHEYHTLYKQIKSNA